MVLIIRDIKTKKLSCSEISFNKKSISLWEVAADLGMLAEEYTLIAKSAIIITNALSYIICQSFFYVCRTNSTLTTRQMFLSYL